MGSTCVKRNEAASMHCGVRRDRKHFFSLTSADYLGSTCETVMGLCFFPCFLATLAYFLKKERKGWREKKGDGRGLNEGGLSLFCLRGTGWLRLQEWFHTSLQLQAQKLLTPPHQDRAEHLCYTIAYTLETPQLFLDGHFCNIRKSK